MRNVTGNTPTGKEQNGEVLVERTSGKKLKQARLPFKIIATSALEGVDAEHSDIQAEGKIKETETQEKDQEQTSRSDRKRRLSYDEENEGERAKSQESKKWIGCKENVKAVALAAAKKKKTELKEDDEIVLLDDDDIEEDVQQSGSVPKTPVVKTSSKDRITGAGTPSSTGKPHGTQKKSATKLQIKLPLSGGKKNKRKKSIVTSADAGVESSDAHDESTDELNTVAGELNPKKRPKIDDEEVTVINLDSDSDDDDAEAEAEAEPSNRNKVLLAESVAISKENERCDLEDENDEQESSRGTEDPPKGKELFKEEADFSNKCIDSSEMNEKEEKLDCKDKPDEDVTNLTDNESESSTEHQNESTESNDSMRNPLVSTDAAVGVPVLSDSSKTDAIQKKNLTPKQLKLMEQRRRAREEKERRLQEEKLKKQREKEAKELTRKLEREEKEEQRRKEREEKEEQKRKEREEKERKRVAEIEAKNEEKRKRNEAKEEEQRKKDDERKRKEQEKEEAEMKQKKAAQAFQKFFKPKGNASTEPKKEEVPLIEVSREMLAFRPFEKKGDMQLAPVCRKSLSSEAKKSLDAFLRSPNADDEDSKDEGIVKKKPLSRGDLYLAELKSGKISPGKWRRPTVEYTKEDDDDIMIIENDLDRAGQAIVEETHGPIERHRAKLYLFHENQRPPYYGTWRKRTKVITPRRPFAQDKKFFDYEVNSDDEWEEEEPGESLNGSDDEKEKESEDDDYEVDNEWFVPHGHLSDEELQNEDELGAFDDNDREAQKAKLKILQQEFVQEMKKKTEKIKPRLIGCIWVDENGNQPDLCPKIIWETLTSRAMLCIAPPLLEEPEVNEKPEPSSPSTSCNDRPKPITLSEGMLKDLVRLVHGNRHSKAFLIKEFIAFLAESEESIKNGDVRGPLKSMVKEKIDEFAEWKVTETKHNNKKKKNKKRLCWVVSTEVLEKMGLRGNITLHNTWQYTLPPKFDNPTKEDGICLEDDKSVELGASHTKNGEGNGADVEEKDSCERRDSCDVGISKRETDIKRFTKVLTAEEKEQQIQKSANKKVTQQTSIKSPSMPSPIATNPPTATSAPAVKKRVPLLMSVARGQQISQPTKNALISEYLKKGSAERKKTQTDTTNSRSPAPPVPPSSNDVIVLD